jgi:multiphosphoryl transfer protein
VEARSAAAAPAVTADGITIEVSANAMSVADVASGIAAGADGVGLFRVEYFFMERAAPPSEEELFDALSSSARGMGGRPFTVRTLDAGADKPVPYLDQRTEANPFLGERGIRLMHVHPDLLDLQCRVVGRLALEHHVRIMFPMVSTIAEFRYARDCVRQHGELLSADGGRATGIEIGVMVEVPSVALQAATFAAEVDFFSIGTNDLAQYTMAAERNNERLGGLADPLQPAVLRLIKLVCDAAASRGRWVGVCGELAGEADATALLIGLGVQELSMSPPLIPAVKAAVRKTGGQAARILASEALELESAAEVRARCQQAGRKS